MSEVVLELPNDGAVDNIEYNDEEDTSRLAARDRGIRANREIENIAKFNIIIGMLKLKHNMKYNKLLLPVYFKSKKLFDEIVDEHTKQIEYLQNIIRHLDNVMHDHVSSTPDKKNGKKMRKTDVNNTFIDNINKEKRKIGRLLVKMRRVLNKLNEVDSIVKITPEIIYTYTPDDFNVYHEVDEDEDDDDEDDDDVLLVLNELNDRDSEISETSDSSETSDVNEAED